MNKLLIILFPLFLSPCNETPFQPPQIAGRIVAYVHWGDQPIEGKKIELVQTGETKLTDSNGVAEFTELPGKYIVRAYDINRGGPSYLYVDFPVEVGPGQKVKVDIVDCLPCV